MTWIETEFGSSNTTTAVGIQFSEKGNEYSVELEKMSVHSPNQSLHLIFRGYKDKFGKFMRRLKRSLPDYWIETIDRNLVNLENAIGIQISRQGVQLEFEVNSSRARLRHIFQGDESKAASFMKRLRSKLPDTWLSTIDGGMVNTSNAIGVRTSKNGVWHEVHVVIDVQRENKPLRTVFRSESESDCKAFLDDLTAALKKGKS